MTPPLSAPESARAIGLCCWLEQQIFSVLGGWVVDIPDPEIRLVVLELSEHAAWRAQRWYELLPTAPPGADVLVTATGPIDALLTEVVDAAGATSALGRAALAEAMLGLADALVARLDDRSAPLASASVRRICGIARTDIAADLGGIRSVMAGRGRPEGDGPDAGTGALLGRFDEVASRDFLDLI